MSVESINEPGSSRLVSHTPPSINEPPSKEDIKVPAITAIDPTGCEIGSEDFTLDVVGTDFTSDSVINFAGHDEPTTFNAPDTLSTVVKPSLWQDPVTVQCLVKNGPIASEPVEFVFSAAPELDEFEPTHEHHHKHKRKR